MLYSLILLTVAATSMLSGILGMAGGMILMAVLVSTVSVASAMLLHGAVQATSNGSRAWFLRRFIRWRIMPAYLVGATLALALFTALTLVPDPGTVLILVGALPWLARVNRHLRGMDITRRATAILCGFLVTATQLLAGASGPLLDVFYLNAPMSRQEIVASKAITQALGHVFKIIYYGVIVAVSAALPGWLFVAAMLCAVAGTRAGTALLMRWNDKDFNRVSQIVILSIATICLIRGAWMLLPL